MKSFTECGGPAFPSKVTQADGSQIVYVGMTLLDYFAAKAMQAILSDAAGMSERIRLCSGNHNAALANVALNAFAMADAMLAERAK